MSESVAAGLSVELPLESDPPWLSAGVGGLTAASALAFVGVFAAMGVTPALGLLPGMTLAVFGGSTLARWSRRRGASAFVKQTPGALSLEEPRARVDLIDLGAPFAAALLVDEAGGRRALVLSQRAEPVVLYEAEAPPAAPRPAASPYRQAPSPFTDRQVTAAFDRLALSAATAHVYTLARGASLDPLLDAVGALVDTDAPLLTLPTAAGPVLTLTPGWVSCGPRQVSRDGLVASDYVLSVDRATVAALGFGAGEGAILMIACEDAFTVPGAATADLTPDAYVSAVTFELLRALLGPVAR